MSPWFKVSDDLPSKPETTRIPRPERISAIGLWALAGAWSAQQLTDGHIPSYMLDELAGTAESAGWLVTAGYWLEVEDGWQFADWAPDQPLRESVLEARRKNAEKVKNWRARNVSSTTVNNSGTNPPVTLPPSRTQPDQKKEHVQHAAHEFSPEFVSFWEVFPRKQAKADAWKAFQAAVKSTDPSTILNGARAYALLHIGDDKNFLKLPAGWLRGERWADETIAPTEIVSAGNFARIDRPAPPAMCTFHEWETAEDCSVCAELESKGAAA